VVGATMWIRSDKQKSLSLSVMLQIVIKTLMEQGPKALLRMVRVDAAMKKHHPKEPHLYLFTIGVLNSARGTGKGRALMMDVLSQCDSENLPVYLESSNPDNHGYYASLDFKTLDVIRPIADSPPLELMWREPRI
jgi:ribosomal protein S18 acetylase RimI-like enzyme